MAGRVRSTLVDLRPLASGPAYRRLWASTSLAAVGAQLSTVAVLFQVWQLTGNPVWVGVIGLAQALPMITGGLIGGHLADVVDRRSLVRWSTAGQALAALALAAQALLGGDLLWLVLLLVAAQSGSGALGAPARRTFVPRLLPQDQVGAGIALQMLSFQVAMLVGPAVAGLVIGWRGVGACYVLNAATLLLSWYAVHRLPAMPTTGAGAGRGWAPLVDGLRLIRRMPVLRGSFLTDLCATLLAMPVALFPVVNEIRFGGDPRTLGLFLSAVAVGGLGAGLLSGAVTRARRSGALQLMAAGTWGAALAGFGLSDPLWAALGFLALAGAADTVSVVSRAAMVQLRTPDSHRGRVSAVDHVVAVAGPDVGNFRAGVVAGLTSAPVALVSGGLLCVAGVVAVACTHRDLRRAGASEEVERVELLDRDDPQPG